MVDRRVFFFLWILSAPAQLLAESTVQGVVVPGGDDDVYSYPGSITRKAPPPVIVRFKSLAGAKKYEIETSASVNFDDHADLRLYPTDKTAVSLKFPTDGTYFWRVRGIDETGKVVVSNSAPRRLVLRAKGSSVLDVVDIPFSFEVSLAPAVLSQEMQGIENFYQLALTPKFEAIFRFSPLLQGEASAGFNAVSVALSSGGKTAQILSFDTGICYTLVEESGWQIRLHGGVFYHTTLASVGAEKFVSMIGPQIYPSVSYLFEDKTGMTAIVKYSPFGVSTVHPIYSGTEFSLNLAYDFFPQQRRYYSLFFDYRSLMAEYSKVRTLTGKSYSIGLAYHF